MDVIHYGPLTLELETDGDETGYCVTACEKDAVEVEIPLRVGEYKVIAIGESAFEDCAELIRVVIPEPEDPMERWDEEWLREIRAYAFSGCTSLIKVNIPDTVNTIFQGAFYDCSSLVEVTFDYWTYMYPYAFSGCSSLVSISELHFASEGILRDCTSLASVTIGESCMEIGEDAFEHCESLRRVVIPASVERIERLAFRGCRSLTHVTFARPNGWYAGNCYTDKQVQLDLSDPERNARRLSGMDFDDGVTAWYRK